MTETPHEPDEQSAPATAGAGPPQTDDIVIDAALRDLAEVPEEDLEGRLAAGEHVQRTLQSRLADLGG